MSLMRPPGPALRDVVRTVWVSGGACAPEPPRRTVREHVLPTGDWHLVFRLGGGPLRLYRGADDLQGETVGHAIVGGPRAGHYVREAPASAHSVGVQLRPGAAWLLFGLPAGELAGRHLRLDDLWGAEAARMHERLLEARDDMQRLQLLEHMLAARLRGPRAMHPAVAQALARPVAPERVATIVRDSGLSHRRFGDVYRDEVGLAPKAHARVRRLQRALAHLRGDTPLAELAFAAGFADQAHFQRDFRDLTGLTPGAYRRAAPVAANHVSVDFQFVQDAPAGRR